MLYIKLRKETVYKHAGAVLYTVHKIKDGNGFINRQELYSRLCTLCIISRMETGL